MIRGEVYVRPLPPPQVLTLIQCQNGSIEYKMDAVYFHCKQKDCMYKEMPNGDLKFIELMSIKDMVK